MANDSINKKYIVSTYITSTKNKTERKKAAYGILNCQRVGREVCKVQTEYCLLVTSDHSSLQAFLPPRPYRGVEGVAGALPLTAWAGWDWVLEGSWVTNQLPLRPWPPVFLPIFLRFLVDANCFPNYFTWYSLSLPPPNLCPVPSNQFDPPVSFIFLNRKGSQATKAVTSVRGKNNWTTGTWSNLKANVSLSSEC